MKNDPLLSKVPHSLFSTKLFCVAVIDREGRLLFVNEVFRNHFVHLAADLLGYPMREMVFPADQGQYDLALRQCMANPGEVVAATLLGPDGQGGFLVGNWEFSLLPDPTPSSFWIICLGQPALAQAVEVSGLEALDALPSCHLLLGLNMKIVNINRPATEWFSFAFGHQLRKGDDFAHFTSKKLFPDFRDDFIKVLGGEKVMKQTVVAGSNGKVYWFDYFLTPVRGRDDRLCGVALHLAAIDAYKNTEAAQKELELVLRSVLDHFPASALAIGLGGCMLVLNRKAREEIKQYHGKAATEGQDFWQFVPKDSIIEVGKLLGRALNGFPSSVEAQIELGNGTAIWREVSYAPIYDAQDNVVGVSVIGQDIAKRLVAEQSLRDSENKLRAILDNTISNMVLISPDFKLLSINRQARQTIRAFFGNQEVKEGDDFWQYVVPGTEEDFRYDFGRALAGERVELEKALINEAGQKFWLAFSYFPVYDAAGRVLGVAFSSLDITARKQAENDLRETERRLEILASNFPDGTISLIDQDLNFLYTDGGAYQQLGLDPSIYTGRPIWEVVHPRVYQEIVAALPHLVPDGSHRFEVVVGGRTYQHTLRTTTTLPTSANHFVLASVDITEHKENEAKVESRNAKLAKIAWQQSHVVRRPLANLLALIELLEGVRDPAEMGLLLAYLKISAQELDQTIHDIVAQTSEGEGLA
jgi:PAS domain S-box-containing protein